MAVSGVREVLYFMCIPAAASEGPTEKSLEEVRVDDYLAAYRTTGRLPPPPCPQTPTNAQERAAMGLPSLFEPVVISNGPSLSEKDLPEWHVFEETKVPGTASSVPESFQIITTAPNYVRFSFEELRYHAYLAGRVHPPPDIQKSSTLQANGIQYGGDTNETFLSITSKPEFSLHSFEELRVAFVRAGRREVTSKEIFEGTRSVPVQQVTSPFSGPSLGGGVFSFSPAIRPF